tara:strand:+ start:190 stop:570 length:381 start_codon:yes stop_codon:yes gene_type:complete
MINPEKIGIEKLSSIFEGISSISIPDIAPKMIIWEGRAVLIIKPKMIQLIKPAKDPKIDLLQTFPKGKIRPTTPAQESPTDKNNNANTATSISKVITVIVKLISIQVAPVKYPFLSLSLRIDLKYF